MPTSAELLLLDTSAAFAWLTRSNPHHGAMRSRGVAARLGLAGHAYTEFVSVATRLQPPHRMSGAEALAVIENDFPESRFLGAHDVPIVVGELVARGIVGGALYDGLVAAAARVHEATLISADRRASGTYDALGVRYELLRAS